MGFDASPLRYELNALLNRYRAALQDDPGNPTRLADVGGILRKLGRHVEALACFRDAAQAFLDAGQALPAAQICGRILRIDRGDSAGLALVERIRGEALLPPESLEQALSGAVRKQRVTDGPPVVVLPPGADVATDEAIGQESWDETIERPMPPIRPLDDLPTLSEDSASPADDPTLRVQAEDATVETEHPVDPDALLRGLIPEDLLVRAVRLEVAAGQTIITEGEPGHDLFVVLRGEAEVVKRVAGGRQAVIEALGPGGFFGELGLLGDGRRHATVTATEASEVLRFDRRSVRGQLKAAPALNRALLTSFRERLQRMLLVASPLLSALGEGDAGRVLSRCKPVRRRAGDVALQAGERSPGIYLVLLGVVEEQGDRGVVLTDGALFGEETFVHGRPSSLSFICRTFCQLLLWPEEAALSVAASRPDLLELLKRVSLSG